MLRCIVGGTTSPLCTTPFGVKAGFTLTACQYSPGTALGLHGVGQRLQVVRDRRDSGLSLVGAIEPLRTLRIEIEGSGLRVGIVDVGRRRRRGIAVAVAEEHLVGEAERLAVRARAAQYRLVIVVAHRVFIGEGLEERRVALLHVEERHGLAGVVRRARGRRAVGRGDRGLQIVQTAGRVFLGSRAPRRWRNPPAAPSGSTDGSCRR